MKRRVSSRLSLAAFLLTAGLASGAVRADEPTHVVPSEMCRGLFLVRVTFEAPPEGRQLLLILDTGASGTSVDPDAIERVTGRRFRAGRKITLRDLHAGPLRIHKARARVHEMDDLGQALGRSIDGILGVDTFKSVLLTLDYPSREVRVGQGELPAPDGERIFPLLGKSRPYLRLDLPDGAAVAVLLDSGSSGGLDLRQSDPVEWEVAPRPVSMSVRYRGLRMNASGRAVGDFTFGPLLLEKPVVQSNADDTTRLAGQDVLRHARWTFDRGHGRIRIEPAVDEPVRFAPVRGMGLGLDPTPDGMRIVGIFPDSPAAAADLRKGDVILAVDGVKVTERGCRGVTFEDDEAGSRRLAIDRNGKSLEVDVPLATLVP